MEELDAILTAGLVNATSLPIFFFCPSASELARTLAR